MSLTFLAIFMIAAAFASGAFAQQSGVQNAISSAQTAIKDSYILAKQAESAGANIDSLIVKLNYAAELLSKSELAYASNDYNSAYIYATQCQSSLDNFAGQANALTTNAQANASQNLILTILPLAVSIGLLCVGIAVWIVLGSRERRINDGSAKI
jgi:hypothetical protein